MSEPGGTEKRPQHYTEIKGPLQIPHGVSFFAQEPFSNVLENISQRAKIHQKQIAFALLYLGRSEELKDITTSAQMKTYIQKQNESNLWRDLGYQINEQVRNEPRSFGKVRFETLPVDMYAKISKALII